MGFNLREWLGFCKHEWESTGRTLNSDYLIKQVMRCKKCGKVKGMKIW
jgi:hypothetical protein